MAENLRQIPPEMQISTGEVIATLPILGFAVGTYLAVDTGIKAKEKLEQVLVDFGRSKRSTDVAFAGAALAVPAVIGVSLILEKIGVSWPEIGSEIG